MCNHDYIFSDRVQAGRLLSNATKYLADADPIVLGLANGGVPVAAKVASSLHAHLDVVISVRFKVRQLGDATLGALVEASPPVTVIDAVACDAIGIDRDYINRELGQLAEQLARRSAVWRALRRPISLRDRTVVVVDDGIAAGLTMKAVAASLRPQQPARLILAVPLAPQKALDELASEYDETICLIVPTPFGTVGGQYRNFPPVSDAEVMRVLGSRHTDG